MVDGENADRRCLKAESRFSAGCEYFTDSLSKAS